MYEHVCEQFEIHVGSEVIRSDTVKPQITPTLRTYVGIQHVSLYIFLNFLTNTFDFSWLLDGS